MNPEIARTLRERADLFDGPDRRRIDRLNRHILETPVRTVLLEHDLEALVLLPAPSRFDKPADEKGKADLVVLFADANPPAIHARRPVAPPFERS